MDSSAQRERERDITENLYPRFTGVLWGFPLKNNCSKGVHSTRFPPLDTVVGPGLTHLYSFTCQSETHRFIRVNR